MNVKELKDYLEGIPDDREIKISDGKGYLMNTHSISQTFTVKSWDELELAVSTVVLYPLRSNKNNRENGIYEQKEEDK